MAQLIVGLGNPGPEYAATRHNLGFRVVAELARRWRTSVEHRECAALTGWAKSEPGTVLLAQPQTYMNRSGYSVRCLLECHRFEAAGVLVVYDEINLPLGRLRLRPNGSPAGHRGLESVIENLRTAEVPRLRLGIGSPLMASDSSLPDFVLAPFAADEQEAVEAMVVRAAEACEVWSQDGTDAAMNRFNR
jgi:PTH1 family peptidyl-tRNA hydrolase